MKTYSYIGLAILFGWIAGAQTAFAADDLPDSLSNRAPGTVIVSDQPINQENLLAQRQGAAPQQDLAPRPTPTPSRQPPLALPAVPRTTPDNALALAPRPTSSTNTASRSPGYSLASTPNMIGDTLGVGYLFFNENASTGKQIAGNVPLGDSSIKISEDCSPLPVDRVFFDYNHFHNALLTADDQRISLNRYTFGLEKTYFDGNSSIQLKAPVNDGLNDVQFVDGPTSANEGTMFGTLSITTKTLLYQNDGGAIAAGLAIGLPTSPNAELQTNVDSIQVFDDAVHLAPYLGFLLQPNNRLFSISYLQFDFDTNGNRVRSGGVPAGRLQDPTVMYVDCSIGYWLFYHDPAPAGLARYLTGLAPVLELHYTTTLQDADSVERIIIPEGTRVDILNLTGGLFFKLGPLAGVTVGGVAPLRTKPADKEFDAEVLVQFNRWF